MAARAWPDGSHAHRRRGRSRRRAWRPRRAHARNAALRLDPARAVDCRRTWTTGGASGRSGQPRGRRADHPAIHQRQSISRNERTRSAGVGPAEAGPRSVQRNRISPRRRVESAAGTHRRPLDGDSVHRVNRGLRPAEGSARAQRCGRGATRYRVGPVGACRIDPPKCCRVEQSDGFRGGAGTPALARLRHQFDFVSASRRRTQSGITDHDVERLRRSARCGHLPHAGGGDGVTASGIGEP